MVNNVNFFSSNQDLFGNSKPILSLSKDSYVVVPKTSVFSDLESEITYDESGNSNDVAKVAYSFNGEYVGEAKVQYAADTKSTYDFDIVVDNSNTTVEEKEPDEGVLFVNVKIIIIVAVVIVALLILIFSIISFVRNYHFSQKQIRWKRKHKRKRKYHSEFENFDF